MPPADEPSFDVPVVDIGPYVSAGSTAHDRTAVSARIDRACSTVGFVQVSGHGIPPETLSGLGEAVDAFFDLPLEVKNTWRVEGANRGYSPPRSESLSLSVGVEAASRMNDFFEAFNVGTEARSFEGLDLSEADYGINLWPDVVGFREKVETYFSEASRVARTLTAIFGDALGVPDGFFPSITDHSVDVLRMNNYALPEGSVSLDGDLTGMGEHTDFGLVTVLWADRERGLQVLGRDHVWHDVSPAPGALLVNVGDLMARLTDDRWLSTLHRVKPPIVDGTIRRRRSAAFFHDGNIDAVIAPLPSDEGPDTRPHYEPIRVRDHISAKLAGSRSGTSNAGAPREAARVLAATRSAADTAPESP